MENLISLDLSYNKLTNITFLKELKGITKLYLNNNYLTGVNFLGELKNLTTIDLSKNNLFDFRFLKDLENLTSLDLRDSNLTSVNFLEELRNLTSLDLSNNKLRDFSFLFKLKSLTSLNLSYNKLTKAKSLKELKNLTSLNLSYNKISTTSFLKELNNLNSLNLGYNNLTDVSFLKELKNLNSLILGYNKLTDVSFLKELKNLNSLILGYNKLTDVSFLKELKNLTTLDLRDNNLTDVSFLKELKNLNSLNLGYNKLTDVSFLKELKNLTTLDLRNNNLTDVSFLKELKNLNSLILGYNKLTDVSFLKELKNLTTLDLRNNNPTDVSFLKELKNLTKLNLRYNNLTDVSFLKEMPQLDYVDLSDNPIINPPEKFWKAGLDKIRNYFKQLEEQGEDYLYEAKIIFVGEPGAGKTSLINKILDINTPISSSAIKETVGILIKEYSFPFISNTSINFKTNLWDFGGQDIQYTLHQFFLTSRALYVFLIDDRKENADLDYWFNIIKLLGEGSPVLVVANEIYKEGVINFDYPTYKARYKDIKMELRQVDLSKIDDRLKDVINKIKEMACCIKGIGDPLPQKWIPIRRDLLDLKSRKHIKYSEEYLKICSENELNEKNDQETLARLFHEIGVFIHFANDENLMDTIFIDPQWITDGLYTIIKDKALRENQGIFSKDKIYQLWGNKYTTEEKSMLMRLMLKNNFEVCYKLTDSAEERYLFPLLLPFERPAEVDDWGYTDNLKFRFQYQFMPKGIITRLLVRLSDYIYKEDGKSIIWRIGAMLSNNKTMAFVYEDISKDGRKVLDIFVRGDQYNKREFLSLIRQEIEYIHKSTFKNIPVEKYVPCNCIKCADRSTENPTYFDYNTLLLYKNSREESINCTSAGSITKVSVDKLLEGIEEKPKEEYLNHERGKPFNFEFNSRIEVNPTFSPTFVDTQSIEPPISQPATKNEKKWYEKIQIWIAIIGGIIAITWSLMQIYSHSSGNDKPVNKTNNTQIDSSINK